MKGVADVYPLTPSQLGILVDTQRDTDPELYFEQVRFDLVGDVDPADLQDAWCRTVEHHPALRTVWLWEGLDQPVQVVRERVELPWTVVDWRDRDDPRPALDRLAADDRRTGFDLRRPPVMRVTVVRLDDDRVHVVWSFDHIMLDGWSAALVLDEILGRHAGRQVADSPPFKEHVAWVGRQDRDAAGRHWRRILDGFDRPNVIAGCRPDDGRPVRLARHRMRLGTGETAELAAVAREQRVTVNTLVQTAWAITLSCLSGDRDVVFGVTGSGRPAEIPGVESIVGMFLATLPMRVRFESDTTVADVWRTVQAQQLDLTQYQYSPLADVTRASDVPSGVALFDTALVFENFPRPDDSRHDELLEPLEVFEQTRFPITVMVGVDDGLELLALVDERRIDSELAERVIDGFVRVLRAGVEAPDRPVGAVTTLPEAERHRLLVDLNHTDHTVPDSTVPDELAAHAAERPDAIAVVDGDRTTTFGELDEAARLVASRLRGRGVGVGDVVVVACPRSADAVAVALGAMRCGAAYLAVGEATPAPRFRAILHDAEPAIAVVASGDTRFVDLDVAVVDVPALTTPAPPDEHSGATDGAAAEVGPDDVMFVVFTSGSTGRPKGVPGTHRAVLNRCAWEREVAPFDDDEIACQKTTFDFVDHVAELWGPLVAGRPVVIVGDDVVRDAPALIRTLATHRIRRLVLVPTLLDVLLDTVPDLGRRLPDLRRWTVSGERLPADLAERFRAGVPDGRLVNVYGMSEVMADATAYDVPAEPAATGSTTAGGRPTDGLDGVPSVPIGRPIRNQRVYVLDELDRPAPVGVPGQIWVSGVGLMPGYWRRDDLTAERVDENPFGEGAHARRYATGDVGRWTPDGQLEYVGRRDRQVKIRGQRVELGDAEAVLRHLPDVRDAVVVEVADIGPTRLVAFVIGRQAGVDGTDLRRRAGEVAPAALVPERIEVVDAFPLLPSGKVDHRALAQRAPRTTPTARIADDDPVGPMVTIWRDVVGHDRIGPDDDFFDVGGNSIDGMRLLARITREHDVNLPLSVLYSAPTPRRLLARVDAERCGETTGPLRHLVPITDGLDDRRRLFCVHGAGGNVLNFKDLADALAPEWGLTGIQANGVDGVTPLHDSLDEMCDAYLAEVLADRGDRPLFLAGFSGGGVVAYEMAARLAEQGRDVAAVVLLDTFHPSFRARRRTVGEHLAALVRQGPSYLGERMRVRRQRRLYVNADEIVDQRRDGEPVPHEMRDAVLVNNNIALFQRDRTSAYAGEVWMYAADDVLDVLRHAGPDRGWAPYADALRCATVPGTHHDFVLAPHVEHLARRLRADLDRALAREER